MTGPPDHKNVQHGQLFVTNAMLKAIIKDVAVNATIAGHGDTEMPTPGSVSAKKTIAGIGLYKSKMKTYLLISSSPCIKIVIPLSIMYMMGSGFLDHRSPTPESLQS